MKSGLDLAFPVALAIHMFSTLGASVSVEFAEDERESLP